MTLVTLGCCFSSFSILICRISAAFALFGILAKEVHEEQKEKEKDMVFSRTNASWWSHTAPPSVADGSPGRTLLSQLERICIE